jgi:hypothetical protein
MRRFVIVILVLLAEFASARGDDWPQFRGPDGQGHSTEKNLPVEWSEAKNLLWKVSVPGMGWSSPVISGDRIWLTSAVDDARGASLRAQAY